MNMRYHWPYARKNMLGDLLRTEPIHTGEWQAMDVSRSKLHATHEILDAIVYVSTVPHHVNQLQHFLSPDLPWAEDHFLERVSGIPHNPPPSHVRWPYAVAGNMAHMRTQAPARWDDEPNPIGKLQFDHTYPERFWPKMANVGERRPNGRQVYVPHNGIRFEYGDLNDVVLLLARNPLTRQAYLPVWFPEDTGAVDNQRVPCTLGYHFLIRNGELSCRYYIRSCDAYRHLNNDVYLACRLMQWVCNEYNKLRMAERKDTIVQPGQMTMYVSSLHLFVGDVRKATS